MSRWFCLVHGGQAEKVGLDRQHVGVGHEGVGCVGHGRIKPRTVLADAAPHGVEEILIAVIADAGVLVGCDVGRIERAERQWESETAGIRRAARRGMTDHAISSLGEIFAAFDDVGLGEAGRNAGRIGLVIVGKRNCRAASKRQRPAGEGTPCEDADGHDDDGGYNKNGDAAHRGYAFFTAMAARSIGRRRRGTPVAA